MNYIIDPKVFWMMSIADSINTLGIMVGVFGFIAVAIYFIIAFVEDYRPKAWIATLLIFATLLGITAATVIPDKDTMVLMTVASVATYENVDAAADEIYKVIDYIDEALED